MKFLAAVVVSCVFSSALTGCTSPGDSGPRDVTEKTEQTFNDKTPAEFFSQFEIKVLECDKQDQSKWLRKAAAVDSSISTMLDLGNGYFASLDLLLTKSRFRMDIEVLQNAASGGISGSKTVVKKAQISGLATSKPGTIELMTGLRSMGSLANGFAYNGEDTAVLVLTEKIASQLDSDTVTMLKPMIGPKLVIKNIRELLSTAEGNMGCSRGAEALVFGP